MQGDAAIRHADGAFTFHGRSDEVINVGGNRIGTEEIESALLVDTERAGSSLRNCAVVGMPDEVLGTVPVAFLVLQPGATLSATDEGRLRALVQGKLGSVAVPAKFIIAEALPETYSGKFMRRLLQLVLVVLTVVRFLLRGTYLCRYLSYLSYLFLLPSQQNHPKDRIFLW